MEIEDGCGRQRVIENVRGWELIEEEEEVREGLAVIAAAAAGAVAALVPSEKGDVGPPPAWFRPVGSPLQGYKREEVHLRFRLLLRHSTTWLGSAQASGRVVVATRMI